MNLQLRRYQQGYVYKTGKKVKTWYGMYREDVQTADGKIIRRQRNIRLGSMTELPTRSEAREELSRLIGLSRKPSVDMTFAELVGRWEETVVPTLKNSTANLYRNTLRSYVLPSFGRMQITKIGRYDVETFLAEQARKYRTNTLRAMRAALSRVLSWAVSCDWIEKNPCAGVKVPRTGKRIVRVVLKPEQVVAIASNLKEPYATLVLFSAVTGARIGEAVGIKWSDFDGDVLHVCRRVYEGKVDSTKTEESDRYVPIPGPLLSRMRSLGGKEWVFESRAGTPVNPGNALKRYIRPVVKKLGIAIGGWHDFRHTRTTDLLRGGRVSPKAVSSIVGHKNVQVTLNVYDHPNVEDFRAPLNEVAGDLLRDVTKSAPVS